MISGFFKQFGKKQIENAAQGLVALMVKFDPETATEAQVAEMNENLDKLMKQMGQAKVTYEKERREATEITKVYNERIAAVHKLKEKAEATADPAQRAALEASATKLLDMITEMAPQVDQEKQEAEEALVYLNELEEAVKQAAANLLTARKKIESARREMARAQLEQERAKKRAEQAEVLAGIKKQSSSLGVAFDAMQKEAEKARIAATAMNAKASLLGKDPKLEADANITAALNEVKGLPDNSGKSLTERLSQLQPK